MKNLKLILLLVFSPLSFFGQELSGLWTGILTNDSSSVRQDQSFEIMLSQYKQKVTGYSRSTFIVNDTLYYIVKRVKGTIMGDVCEVKDEYVISHNFPKKPDKGVKVISTFRRNLNDSTWYLEGDWKTTKTKKYYTVSGKVDLKEEKDLSVSKLMPHLEELGLNKDLPIYASAKKPAGEQSTNSKSAPTKNGDNKDLATTKKTNSDPAVEQQPASSKKPEPGKAITEQGNALAKNSSAPAEIKSQLPGSPVVPAKQNTGSNAQPASPVNTSSPANGITKNNNSKISRANNVTTQPVSNKPVETSVSTEAKNNNAIATTNPAPVGPTAKSQPVQESDDMNNEVVMRRARASQTTAPVPEQPKKTVASVKPEQVDGTVRNEATLSSPQANREKLPTGGPLARPAVPMRSTALPDSRKTDEPQYVSYVSDSLVLILYDNGEVDGDTVSVFLNGEIFMDKQGLKTSAIKKTIYITPGKEELTLILFAENLGRYPPNTGLLVVYDGEERHQLRFTADLQKNASVIFKRRSKL